MTEHINAAKNMIKDADAKVESQYTKYKQKFNEAISIAKSYKAKYEETVNHYIETKADLLGVRTSEITNRLQENYSLADVDTVCESLLEEPAQFSNTLFKGLNNGAKMKINESLDVTEKPKKSEADDIFDGLLELAGLKK